MNFVEELREMDRVMRAFNGCCEPVAPTVLYRNRPVTQQAAAQPSLPAGPSGDTLADFRTGQWWHRELEMALKHGNPDQRRALAVLRNLLKTVEATVAAAQTP